MNRSDVTVHLIDDEPVVLDALRSLIESVGLQTSTYGTARAFLDAFDPSAAGCLVLDVRLPDRSGLELQTELRERGIDLPVILITGNADVDMAVRGMRNGAVNFFQKPLNGQLLLESVQEALRVNDRKRCSDQARAADQLRLSLLTERERQVVDRVVEGRANKQIARELAISQKTVELHRSRAMKKLEARHVSDLVILMLRSRAEE